MNIRRPYRRRPAFESVLEKVNTFIGKKTLRKLQALADEKDLPVSRLISYAIDNEFGVDVPFSFDYTIPENPPYVEFQYAKEAQKVLTYLRNFPTGVGIDTLVLCRREYEIQEVSTALLAIREIIKMDMAITFHPRRSLHHYAKTYHYIKINPEFARSQRDTRSYKSFKSTYTEEKGPLNDVTPEATEE